jgi:hypothetical protein
MVSGGNTVVRRVNVASHLGVDLPPANSEAAASGVLIEWTVENGEELMRSSESVALARRRKKAFRLETMTRPFTTVARATTLWGWDVEDQMQTECVCGLW